MKTDFKQVLKNIWPWTKNAAKRFWSVLSRNFWMKMLSLLLAILLWNYVVTTNKLITRTKTLNDLTGYVTSQANLSTYGLALLDNPAELIDDVTVRLEVSQADYSMVSADNVQVTLDLSKVRTAGSQEVSLRATTAYGKVTAIYPPSITLTFETLDSRSIPVNASLSGVKSEDYWYSISRTNPSVITVSGAASAVRSISQARVSTDITGVEETYMRAEPYVLVDVNGEEVDHSMLTRSSSSITVIADVYPSRDIPVSSDIAETLIGRPAEGYTVSSITIQPERITVAADQELLDSISALMIEPISVEGLSKSFTARAKVTTLPDFKYTSAQQVYVNVNISEKDISEWLEDAEINFVGKAENMQLEWQRNPVRVYVTGPRSEIEALLAEGLAVTVDLTGLDAGTHSCELRFPVDSYPEVTFEAETPTISVTLAEIAEE